MDDMTQFLELLRNVSIDTFELGDQLRVALAFTEFMKEVKPIYAKYASEDSTICNFIMKL